MNTTIKSKLLTFGVVMACSFMTGVPLAKAEGKNIPPELIEVSTPLYQPSFSEFDPQLGTYTYDVSWQGIPAATLKVTVDRDDQHYRIETKAETASGIDIFYKLRFKAEGLLSVLDLQPVRMEMVNQENSRIKNTEITFLDSGEVRTVRSEKGKSTKILQFDPHNFMLDPFSASFLARSLSWKEGETKEFDTFNGKTRYLISLTAQEKIKMKINGEKRDVWLIVPKVYNLSNQKQNEKLREATIYVTADSRREILKIKSSVFIGSVTTSLENFVPAAQTPPGTRFARLQNNSTVIK